MFSIDVLPGFIMGFREGLEAFLIIALMLGYLKKSKREHLRKNVYMGLGFGILASLVFGVGLFAISNLIGDLDANIAKLGQRYRDGYSDEAAQQRADKEEGK